MADLKLIETDSETLYYGIIQAMEIMTGEPLYPGDERRIFAEAMVQLIVAISNQCNTACKNKMLQYAFGEALDALGYRMGVERMAAVPATATFEFTLADELLTDLTIPAGTLITTDGDVFFSTDADLTVTAGSLTGTVTGTCTTPGEDGNGFIPGAIGQLVNMLDGVAKAQNTTESSGGIDEEDDESLRERIHLSNSTFSTAGPTKAYQYYAESADSSIIDVVVNSPSACRVDIYVLTENGIPSQGVLDAVDAICSADDVRPLTDQVTVNAPTAVSYDIEIKYYTTAEDEADCMATIEGAGGVIDQYKAWQAGEIGRNVNPNKLMAMCMAPEEGTGCLRMDITYPEAAQIGDFSVAIADNVTITHEVVSE